MLQLTDLRKCCCPEWEIDEPRIYIAAYDDTTGDLLWLYDRDAQGIVPTSLGYNTTYGGSTVTGLDYLLRWNSNGDVTRVDTDPRSGLPDSVSVAPEPPGQDGDNLNPGLAWCYDQSLYPVLAVDVRDNNGYLFNPATDSWDNLNFTMYGGNLSSRYLIRDDLYLIDMDIAPGGTPQIRRHFAGETMSLTGAGTTGLSINLPRTHTGKILLGWNFSGTNKVYVTNWVDGSSAYSGWTEVYNGSGGMLTDNDVIAATSGSTSFDLWPSPYTSATTVNYSGTYGVASVDNSFSVLGNRILALTAVQDDDSNWPTGANQIEVFDDSGNQLWTKTFFDGGTFGGAGGFSGVGNSVNFLCEIGQDGDLVFSILERDNGDRVTIRRYARDTGALVFEKEFEKSGLFNGPPVDETMFVFHDHVAGQIVFQTSGNNGVPFSTVYPYPAGTLTY